MTKYTLVGLTINIRHTPTIAGIRIRRENGFDDFLTGQGHGETAVEAVCQAIIAAFVTSSSMTVEIQGARWTAENVHQFKPGQPVLVRFYQTGKLILEYSLEKPIQLREEAVARELIGKLIESLNQEVEEPKEEPKDEEVSALPPTAPVTVICEGREVQF